MAEKLGTAAWQNMWLPGRNFGKMKHCTMHLLLFFNSNICHIAIAFHILRIYGTTNNFASTVCRTGVLGPGIALEVEDLPLPGLVWRANNTDNYEPIGT